MARRQPAKGCDLLPPSLQVTLMLTRICRRNIEHACQHEFEIDETETAETRLETRGSTRNCRCDASTLEIDRKWNS